MVIWVLIAVAAAAAVSLGVGLAVAAVLRRIAWQMTQLLEYEEWTSASSGELKLGGPRARGQHEDSAALGGRRAF